MKNGQNLHIETSSTNTGIHDKSISEKSEQLKTKMEKMRRAIEDYKEYKIEQSFTINSINNSKIMGENIDNKLDSSKESIIDFIDCHDQY